MDQSTKTEDTPNILGNALDIKLTYKLHVDITLKNAYAKIAPVLRIKSLVPSSVMITLYIKPTCNCILNIALLFYCEYRNIYFKLGKISYLRLVSFHRFNEHIIEKTY